ncbi:hypothetical protein CWIS_04930 [Cellulomonas sp. A375-1]|uniref:helix-turn-helix domain-containing protein n=1 Tax=Cellulomonas sp. A375-1 TaxID=1672219 RepID=UPI000652832C|nr:helix-turn-helix domain-containing protein [Cellulomonas sp. A375-1]KMM46485.1 hypothetical protein CWIS_04930 [Cellulomonas sp. A375-1]
MIDDEWTLLELGGLVEMTNRGRQRRGLTPLPYASSVVEPARAVVTLIEVAQSQPFEARAGAPGGAWITAAQAASRLGVSPQAITKRARAGTLAATKVAGCWWIEAKETAQ